VVGYKPPQPINPVTTGGSTGTAVGGAIEARKDFYEHPSIGNGLKVAVNLAITLVAGFAELNPFCRCRIGDPGYDRGDRQSVR